MRHMRRGGYRGSARARITWPATPHGGGQMTADTLSLLRAILAEQQRQAGELHALRLATERGRGTQPPALRKAQSDALALIAPVLAGVFGAAPFGSWEACDRARARTSEGANLRLALAGRNARQLGKLLEAGQGHDIDGVTIQRAGRDGDGVLWKCVASALA